MTKTRPAALALTGTITGFLAVLLLASPMLPTGSPAETVTYGPDYPSRVVAAHDCWTGEAPADVEFPGHVVIRMEGETTVKYRGEKYVGLALEHIFDGADNGVAQVVAFCR